MREALSPLRVPLLAQECEHIEGRLVLAKALRDRKEQEAAPKSLPLMPSLLEGGANQDAQGKEMSQLFPIPSYFFLLAITCVGRLPSNCIWRPEDLPPNICDCPPTAIYKQGLPISAKLNFLLVPSGPKAGLIEPSLQATMYTIVTVCCGGDKE